MLQLLYMLYHKHTSSNKRVKVWNLLDFQRLYGIPAC